MIVYRIARSTYIRDLSGTGAKQYGGRWNPKGVAVLYTSEYRSLAVLELLVHAGLQSQPKDLHILELEIPESEIPVAVDSKELPDHWRKSPAPYLLAEIGLDWITSGDSLTLKVPSAVVPEEHNILINPNHAKAKQLSIKSVSSFSLDSRFLAKNNS